MEIVKVFELELYSEIEIRRFIDHDFLDVLVHKRIVRRYTEENKSSLEVLLNFENVDSLLKKNNGVCYCFLFVGIININRRCIISYPKYIKNKDSFIDQNYEILRQVLDVIEKCKGTNQKQNIEIKENEGDFNLLAYTLELLKDYHNYGLYENELSAIEVNGQGEIFWDKTIAEMTAYISDDIPIYLDFYTYGRVVDNYDFVRNLHKVVLTQCTKDMASVLTILGKESLSLSGENIDSFGNKDYILYRLRQEYSRQFETRKKKVIKMLISYIKNDGIDGTLGDLGFIGTINMQDVWEKVCAEVFDNCLDRKLSELSLNYQGCDSRITYVKDIVPRPIWSLNNSSKSYLKKTMRLDILRIDEDGISIFDAKYYNIELKENTIEGNPGVQDIVKQFFYEMSYQKFAQQNKLSIVRNAFLFPSDQKDVVKSGRVSMELFFEHGVNSIDIIYVSARELYERYLKDKKIKRDEIVS